MQGTGPVNWKGEEEEEFIASGDWGGKHNSLSRTPRTAPLNLLPCSVASGPVVTRVGPPRSLTDGLLIVLGQEVKSSVCAPAPPMVFSVRAPLLWTDLPLVILGEEVESCICSPFTPLKAEGSGGQVFCYPALLSRVVSSS